MIMQNILMKWEGSIDTGYQVIELTIICFKTSNYNFFFLGGKNVQPFKTSLRSIYSSF